ncbi:MAG: hypothetical protein JSU09_02755 [Bacteroidetes bacterium]|nr:hypothetical protein [Bacteroidota bacterium]
MRIRILFTLLVATASSCGILGVYQNDVDLDPEAQARLIAEFENKPIAKKMDSLINRIDASPTSIPNDINETTLVIETYQYHDFLRLWENKFYTPKDDKKQKRLFIKYERKKNTLVKNPKYKIVYLDKGSYDSLDISKFRYVLKTTNRLQYEPSKITVSNDGFVSPIFALQIFFIYDRKTGEVYKEIVNLSALSKN